MERRKDFRITLRYSLDEMKIRGNTWMRDELVWVDKIENSIPTFFIAERDYNGQDIALINGSVFRIVNVEKLENAFVLFCVEIEDD